MYAPPGEALTVRVPLAIGGLPAVADSGSVTYTVYGEGGAPATGLVDVPLSVAPGTVEVLVVVPAPVNATSLRVSARSVRVKFASGGRPGVAEARYRLSARLPTWVTPEAVRGLLGAARDEIADDEVDLVQAYLEVEAQLGSAPLAAALAAGDRSTYLANDAVALRAALALLPSAQARYAKSRTDGTLAFERSDRIDWERLAADLAGRYGAAVGAIAGAAAAGPPLLVLTTPVDPVTNNA